MAVNFDLDEIIRFGNRDISLRRALREYIETKKQFTGGVNGPPMWLRSGQKAVEENGEGPGVRLKGARLIDGARDHVWTRRQYRWLLRPFHGYKTLRTKVTNYQRNEIARRGRTRPQAWARHMRGRGHVCLMHTWP